MTTARAFGDWGENVAANFLAQNGYELIDRNYRVRRGELDLVAWRAEEKEKTLCFIEVKTRRGFRGSAERATTKEKRRRMERAARHWCLTHRIRIDRTPIQFEQVSIYDTGTNQPEILHYILPAT